jgi:hypothetical protein
MTEDCFINLKHQSKPQGIKCLKMHSYMHDYLTFISHKLKMINPSTFKHTIPHQHTASNKSKNKHLKLYKLKILN